MAFSRTLKKKKKNRYTIPGNTQIKVNLAVHLTQMLSLQEYRKVSPWMLIYIILILFLVTEATLLPLHYWLPL